MFDFESALLGERGGVPLHEASSFFLEMRSPLSRSMQKTAGLTDPPDETGSLEGKFEVPVENVVALIKNALQKAFALLNATLIYENVMRGPMAETVRRAMGCKDYEYRYLIEYLTKRSSVLAGAVHVDDIEPPPAMTDPISIAKSIIRGEQEVIQALQELKATIGEGNPMKDKVCSFMSQAQDRADDMWRALDLQPPAALVSPMHMVRHEVAETPEQEALESSEFESAEELAGVEQPMEVQDSVKTAAAARALYPKKSQVKRHDKDVDLVVKKAVAIMAKIAKEAPTNAELRESGRQSGVKSIAAEHERERSRRGERAGKSVGALAGIAGGGALGKKLVGGKAGTLGGAVLGGLAGRSIGGEVGTEVDIARAKVAAEERKRGWGEAVGSIGGAVAGGGVGGLAGGIAGAPGGATSLLLGGAGMTAGSLAGEALGSRLGRSVDERLTAKVAAARMVAWVKLAQDMPGMGSEAPMASGTDQPEMEPTNYMQAEQIGRRLQEQNESNFHKLRAARAEQAAMQATQLAEQRAQQAEQEAMAVIGEAAQAQQKVQEALGEAMAAKDEALRQTETAARMRMATQDMRMKLMELASQEPDMVAAMNLAATTAPPAEVMGAEAPDAAMAPPPEPGGPAGGAPQPNTSPGAAPPEGAPDMNSPAGGPPGPEGQGAMPATKLSGVRRPFEKRAGWMGALGVGAAGAAAAGWDAASQHKQGIQPAQAAVQRLEQSQDGSWAQASALARAQHNLANAHLMQSHPQQTALRSISSAALKGALAGHAFENDVRYLLGK